METGGSCSKRHRMPDGWTRRVRPKDRWPCDASPGLRPSGRLHESDRRRGLISLARLFVLAVCSSMVGCAAGRPDASSNDPELSTSEVLATLRAFDEASQRKDTAAAAEFLADNYSYFSSTGGVRSREWLLEDLLGNPDYEMDYSERDEVRMFLHGAAAVVSSRWRGQGTYNGQPIRDDQRCSLVMVKDGSRVRIVMEHCTQIAPRQEM